MSNAHILDNVDTDYLDSILIENGLLRPVPANLLESIPTNHIIIWCNKNGIYCLPTVELLEWLKEQIGESNAIEICSGNGCIGRSLNITRTDSYIQTTAEMIMLYQSIGQKPILPPPDVLRFEANEAVDHFKPDVVLGSFITQKFCDGDTEARIGSSVYGVDELTLIKKVKTYIAIGNDAVHGTKRINSFPHSTYRFPWIYTRCMNQNLNNIKVWKNEQ
jgi:hypothetical protein